MRHITENELIEILKRRKDNKMIKLTDCKFSYHNLSHKYIQNIQFIRCDFSCVFLNETLFDNCEFAGTKFTGATLYKTKFIKSKIDSSSFHYANLSHSVFVNTLINGTIMSYSAAGFAKFINCDLFNIDFSSSTLCYSKFINTSLRKIYFRSSNLSYVIFDKCLTEEIDFDGSNLYGTILDGFQNEYIKGKILTENIIGYKISVEGYVIVLEIPAGAIVFSVNGDKCRTNKAKVIDICNPLMIEDKATRVHSMFDKRFSYYIGDEFNIKDFDLQYNNECSSGIHFFMTREKLFEFMEENFNNI